VLYITEQPGAVRVLVNGKLRAQPFIDISSMVKSAGEQGLLSIAFHPRYSSNHRFFLYFNDTTGDVRVYEFQSNGTIGLPNTGRSLLRVPHREFDNHDGGQLQFGPDGLLYAGIGDGGSGGDPHNHAQNLSSRLGKLLRLNVNKAGVSWRIVAYGLRNPWQHIYRGKAVPAARGRYFYGDYCTGEIWSLRAVRGKLTSNRKERIRVNSLSSFGQDAAGELYATSLGGQLYRLTR
jgi:Glucose / Sorbosone dehydrogenase